jgi:hypothetical protein
MNIAYRVGFGAIAAGLLIGTASGAVSGVVAAAHAAPAPYPTAREHCHRVKCEEHRLEARAHIPHHIHHGIRW